ncbi:MAG: hypothetical protein K6E56_04115, partial [Lachnospiraceae bacterium]|nr:hypothetical protein [Lachnospiraceae bacterium]
FGDSNTYGADTEPIQRGLPLGRFDENTRWTALLQKRLGSEYQVIEEGLGGRTTVFDDPAQYGKSGYAALDIIFGSHDPLDLFIIMLGTNDLRGEFCANAVTVYFGMMKIVNRLKDLRSRSLNPNMEILIVSPPPVIMRPEYFVQYDPKGIEELKKLPKVFTRLSHDLGVKFVDAAPWTDPGTVDGIHLDPAGHAIFAEKMEEQVHLILDK